jgi:aspartyl aminopeptidase
MENKIAWEKYPEGNKREEVFQFAENYRKFISDCKTERECVTSFVEKAEKAGFVNLEKVIAEHTALKAGDRVYANNMGKGMALFVIGKESMEKGMNILFSFMFWGFFVFLCAGKYFCRIENPLS